MKTFKNFIKENEYKLFGDKNIYNMKYDRNYDVRKSVSTNLIGMTVDTEKYKGTIKNIVGKYIVIDSTIEPLGYQKILISDLLREYNKKYKNK